MASRFISEAPRAPSRNHIHPRLGETAIETFVIHDWEFEVNTRTGAIIGLCMEGIIDVKHVEMKPDGSFMIRVSGGRFETDSLQKYIDNPGLRKPPLALTFIAEGDAPDASLGVLMPPHVPSEAEEAWVNEIALEIHANIQANQQTSVDMPALVLPQQQEEEPTEMELPIVADLVAFLNDDSKQLYEDVPTAPPGEVPPEAEEEKKK